MNPTDAVTILHQYGGWGCTVILGGVIACMHNRYGKLFEDRHKEYVSLIREVTAAIQACNDSVERSNSIMTKIEGRL